MSVEKDGIIGYEQVYVDDTKDARIIFNDQPIVLGGIILICLAIAFYNVKSNLWVCITHRRNQYHCIWIFHPYFMLAFSTKAGCRLGEKATIAVTIDTLIPEKKYVHIVHKRRSISLYLARLNDIISQIILQRGAGL